MKIEILGTRAKIEASAPGHLYHSGFLIDDKILIDVGEEIFLEKNPDAIVFTHFHPDHAFFVPDQKIFLPNSLIFGPESHPLVPKLKVITGSFEIEGYKFTPVPVIHALKLKSLGYLVEKNSKKVFFTGDVAWIEKNDIGGLPKVDLTITEGTFIRKGGRINRKKNKIFGHTGIPDLIRILAPFSQKIVFTHLGNWFFDDPDKAAETIKALEPEETELITGQDGMTVNI